MVLVGREGPGAVGEKPVLWAEASDPRGWAGAGAATPEELTSVQATVTSLGLPLEEGVKG